MIEIYRLSKIFGEKIAVNDVSFSVDREEILTILGPNGAGKTTIIRLISCLLIPTKGEIKIFGYDIWKDQNEIRKITGVLPEFSSLYPRMKIYEYLKFFARLYEVSEKDFKERIEKLYKIFGIENENLILETLSKGLRQKVSLIRALIHNPSVILLDEPTSGLDPESSQVVREYIGFLKRQGKIILIATHNLQEAEYLSDRIAIIKNGKIIFLDTPYNLKKNLKTEEKFLIRYFSQDYLKENLYNMLENFSRKENLPLSINYVKNREIEFTTKDSFKTNPKILEFLQKQGVKIISCENISTSLEEAYINLVRDE
jgi:ABC-2 type transport system ATP-binding protein